VACDVLDELIEPKRMRVPLLPSIVFLLLDLTAVAGWTSAANAADAPGGGPREEASQEAREVARVHFAKGLERAGQSDYEGALREFTEAYSLSPHFAVLYNIGQSQIALGRPLEAVETLSKYLRDGQEQVPSDRRLQVEAQVQLLQFLFAELTITTDRPGALIFIDGREVGRTPLYQSVRLAAGTHTVSAVVQGMSPIVRTVTIAHGERQVLNLEVPASPTVAAKAAGAQPPSAIAPPSSGVLASAGGKAGSGPDGASGSSVPVLVGQQATSGTTARGRALPELAYAAVGIGAVLGGTALTVYLRNRGRYQDWQDKNAALKNDRGAIDYYARQMANNQLADSLAGDNHLIAGLSIAGGALIAGGLTFLIHDRLRGGKEGTRAGGSTDGFNLAWTYQGSSSGSILWSTPW
jgi:tetratricopeptide (TPR) repeat protein